MQTIVLCIVCSISSPHPVLATAPEVIPERTLDDGRPVDAEEVQAEVGALSELGLQEHLKRPHTLLDRLESYSFSNRVWARRNDEMPYTDGEDLEAMKAWLAGRLFARALGQEFAPPPRTHGEERWVAWQIRVLSHARNRFRSDRTARYRIDRLTVHLTDRLQRLRTSTAPDSVTTVP